MKMIRNFLRRWDWHSDYGLTKVVDNYWAATIDGLPSAIGLCWVWCGTNVIGFFWNGFCVVGIEYRIRSESPSLSIILWNLAFGVWFPEDEGDDDGNKTTTA